MAKIEVPDIQIFKNGTFHSLRNQKIFKNDSWKNFGEGSGFFKNGDLYVLNKEIPFDWKQVYTDLSSQYYCWQILERIQAPNRLFVFCSEYENETCVRIELITEKFHAGFDMDFFYSGEETIIEVEPNEFLLVYSDDNFQKIRFQHFFLANKQLVLSWNKDIVIGEGMQYFNSIYCCMVNGKLRCLIHSEERNGYIIVDIDLNHAVPIFDIKRVFTNASCGYLHPNGNIVNYSIETFIPNGNSDDRTYEYFTHRIDENETTQINNISINSNPLIATDEIQLHKAITLSEDICIIPAKIGGNYVQIVSPTAWTSDLEFTKTISDKISFCGPDGNLHGIPPDYANIGAISDYLPE